MGRVIAWCTECRGVCWVDTPEEASRPGLKCFECAAPKVLRVWDADNQDEPEEPNVGTRTELSDVAERFAKARWEVAEYPETMRIHVRDACGTLYRFEVSVEMVPRFRAAEVHQSDERPGEAGTA